MRSFSFQVPSSTASSRINGASTPYSVWPPAHAPALPTKELHISKAPDLPFYHVCPEPDRSANLVETVHSVQKPHQPSVAPYLLPTDDALQPGHVVYPPHIARRKKASCDTGLVSKMHTFPVRSRPDGGRIARGGGGGAMRAGRRARGVALQARRRGGRQRGSRGSRGQDGVLVDAVQEAFYDAECDEPPNVDAAQEIEVVQDPLAQRETLT